MNANVHIEDVKQAYATQQGDFIIQTFIDLLSEADQCLIDKSLSLVQIRTLKILSIAHLLVMNDGGQVRSESDMDGESVTYNVKQGGDGFGETSFGRTAQNMLGYECISKLINKPKRFIGAVG